MVLNMPALSPTMTQGNIGAWKKKIGDSVTAGDVLVEIETDKAQMEFECQDEGFLAKILMPEGTKEALVGKPLAILARRKEDVDKFKDYSIEEENSTPKARETQSKPSQQEASQAESKHDATREQPSKDADSKQESRPEGRVFASPLAKSMAKSSGINLAEIKGSGPNGRIIKQDLQTQMPRTTKGSDRASIAFLDIPLSNMRKIIAQRLTESKQAIPHYYLSVDIRMDTLLQVRERFNAKGSGEFKISVNDFLVKAAARAMTDVPAVNSAWHGTFIRQYHQADISVAVATDNGLITPIIANANLKGLVAISSEMRDLVSRARENKLRPEQFQGGTFTISNLGMFGIKHFTAIINPPQSCILAVGTTEQRIIPHEDGSPQMANMMTVTMSCDHRVVDGATGAHWLKYFKKYLEDPVSMIL